MKQVFLITFWILTGLGCGSPAGHDLTFKPSDYTCESFLAGGPRCIAQFTENAADGADYYSDCTVKCSGGGGECGLYIGDQCVASCWVQGDAQ